MGFRFQKRIRVFKGLTLNLSKSGTSWTVGGRGASINLKDGKASGNVGIPGTGLSYRERLDDTGNPGSGKGGGIGWVVWLVISIVLLGVLFGR
jgi:hypothetical protein